jgi:hypothetical protein
MKFSYLLVILCSCVVNGLALDREAFTFTNYDLNVRVEPEQQRLAVRGKITLRNDSATPQKNLSLQISSALNWRAIQANGKAVQFVSQPYTSDIDHTGALSEAIVMLPAAILPKQTVELEIGYEGVVPLDVTRLTRLGVPEQTAKHSDWDQIGKSFTAVRGIGYVAWYPVATESASLSDENSVFETVGRWKARNFDSAMSVSFQATPGQRLWFSGEPLGAKSGSEEEQESAFRLARFGNLVPSFAIAEYEELQSAAYTSIAFLSGEETAAKDYALAAELASTFVTEWFGPPKEKAVVVEVADAEAAPFEDGSALLTPLNTKTDARLSQMTAVHQLTHAAVPSPRLWIYEGVAHFAQALYREDSGGRAAAIDFLSLHGIGVIQIEKSIAEAKNPNTATDNSLIRTTIPELYRGKAMYVWWMLRDTIGDASLKRVLAAYHTEADKDPAYLQRLVSAETKRDLEWFFDDWVYRERGLPDFRIESAFPRATVGGGYVVTVTVENLGNAGAEVPVTLKVGSVDVTKRLEVRAKSKSSIRIEAPGFPQQVIVNDGSVPESDVSNNTFKIEALNH